MPELYCTGEYLCPVSEGNLTSCEGDCIHRRDIACDEDFFTLCTYIMAQNNLHVPVDAFMEIDLYISLREELTALLNVER